MDENATAAAPAAITQAEWDEVLSFVRELRPLLANFAGLGEKVARGGLAGIAAMVLKQ